jgi:RNA polymerase sigma-B factor
LPRRCGRPVGVGFSAVPPMASPLSSSRRRQPAVVLSRSALNARDALVLEHLPLADAIASAAARRLFPLVEREDLIQVAREALVRSAPRCRAGEPAAPYLRRCISGALQHHLRDRVRLVRVPRRLHEQGQCPLRHLSLDASVDGEPCLLDQLASPEPEVPASGAEQQLVLEQLVDQLPAAQAIALRLTVLEGLSLRTAAEQLEISAMSVQRAQKKAIAALRKQLGP